MPAVDKIFQSLPPFMFLDDCMGEIIGEASTANDDDLKLLSDA